MYTSKVCLLVFMFLTVLFSVVNSCKMIGHDRIPYGNFILQTIGIVGIVAYFL